MDNCSDEAHSATPSQNITEGPEDVSLEKNDTSSSSSSSESPINQQTRARGEAEGDMEIPLQAMTQENTEQHSITAPSGKRYVALIYKPGLDGKPEEIDDDDNDSKIGRKLCLNLLTEFVKGNHSIRKLTSEQSPTSSTSSHMDYQTSKPSTERSQELTPSSETVTSLQEKESGEPPYKKARFGWQIKNSQRPEPEHNDSSESEGESSSGTDTSEETTEERTKASRMTSETESCSSVSSTDELAEDKCVDTGKIPLSFTAEKQNKPSSYPDRLQNHHIAKSIVDNAINRTLEDMGLSPDQLGSQRRQQLSRQRQRVEDVGVAQVIQERGLQQPDRTSFPSLHGPQSLTQQLRPFVDRLTALSDNIQTAVVATRNATQTGQPAPREVQQDQAEESPIPVTPEASQSSEENSTALTSPSCSVDGSKSISEDGIEDESISISEDGIEVMSSSPYSGPIEKEEVSSSYVLDRALNAAITERGLQF